MMITWTEIEVRNLFIAKCGKIEKDSTYVQIKEFLFIILVSLF